MTAAAQSAFIPEVFALGTEDGRLYVVDLRYPGRFVDRFELSAQRLISVQFSPSHQDVVMGASVDGQVRLYRFGYRSMQLLDLSAN